MICNLTTVDVKPEPMTVRLVRACSDSNICSTEAFLLSGRIFLTETKSTLEILDKAIKSHPKIKYVCLNSIGGENESAAALAMYISEAKLNTCLSTKFKNPDGSAYSVENVSCQSSCTWLMLAGKERVIFNSNIRVGFHGSRNSNSFGSCTIDRGPNPAALSFWEELITTLAKRHEQEASISAQKNLLAWSFDIGYGKTELRDIKQLIDQDHYFTIDLRDM